MMAGARQLARGTMAEQKKSRRAGPKREIPPAKLAYEWADRHHCLGEAWASIARSERTYTLDQVRKNGNAILKQLEMRQ